MTTSTSPTSTAYLLIFHGSRDPRPQMAASRLASLFASRIAHGVHEIHGTRGIHGAHRLLNEPDNEPGNEPEAEWGLATDQCPTDNHGTIAQPVPLVSTAYLECGPLPLHQQIQDLSQKFGLATMSRPVLRLLPLFLLAGVHVQSDIPAEVAEAQAAIGDRIRLECAPHLGAHPRLRRVLSEKMAPLAQEAWILLAHGSRQAHANQLVTSLAEHLGCASAFWTQPPTLAAQVEALVAAGIRQIGILPYFLFPGGITDAIAQQVQALAQQLPTARLHLAAPLDAQPELADLLVDLALRRV